MAASPTYTSSLGDSLPDMVMAARQTREYVGVVPNLVDRQTLGSSTGLTWHEVQFAQLTAQGIGETEVLDNPQEITDTDLPVTPTVVGIHTLVLDRVKERIAEVALSQLGTLGQNAIQRKKDDDGIVTIDGATTALGATGAAMDWGLIAAGANRITGNTTEGAIGEIHCVLHPHHFRDIDDQITSGALGTAVGTANAAAVTPGLTQQTFMRSYRGMISDANMWRDGNIPIDGDDDAKGGVFAREGIILVQGRSPYVRDRDEPGTGGGATSIFLYDEYAYGERSSGNWLYEIVADATAPTS